MTAKISEDMTYPSKFVEVYGSKMHYVECGQGDPVVFLHGIPTSSYIWRNIIPYLEPLGRCIALDLIGYGQSDKPDMAYSVLDHIKYFEKFVETLHLKNITLVMHGWGALIGLDYAMRHEDNCKGLVFFEAPLRSLEGEDISLPFQELLIELQHLANTKDAITSDSIFVDKMIPRSVMRKLTDKEMNTYRQPFVNKGTCKPILTFLNELPNGGFHGQVDAIIKRYSHKLMHSKLPKLLLYAMPGLVTPIATVMWAKEHLPNLEIIDLGEALHYAQETNPFMMGEAISVWLQGAEVTSLSR